MDKEIIRAFEQRDNSTEPSSIVQVVAPSLLQKAGLYWLCELLLTACRYWVALSLSLWRSYHIIIWQLKIMPSWRMKSIGSLIDSCHLLHWCFANSTLLLEASSILPNSNAKGDLESNLSLEKWFKSCLSMKAIGLLLLDWEDKSLFMIVLKPYTILLIPQLWLSWKASSFHLKTICCSIPSQLLLEIWRPDRLAPMTVDYLQSPSLISFVEERDLKTNIYDKVWWEITCLSVSLRLERFCHFLVPPLANW